MKCSEKQMMDTRDMVTLPNNPRTITTKDLNRLCDSIRQNGWWPHRPIAVERQEWTDKWVVLDGNQRLKAARRMKMRMVPVVIYSELTDDERTDLILRSNINNGEWDTGLLQTDFDGVDFEDIGLKIELPEPPEIETAHVGQRQPQETLTREEAEQLAEEEAEGAQEAEDRMAFYYKMIGDFIYPSDNQYEIPLLLDDNQPIHLELPLAPWGAEARYKKDITTYHFYVDDYRFEALFKNPFKLLESGCRAIVEPNCSIHDQTPTAFAIYQIYKKRYLARYLQECGVQVWVDLNVSPRFEEYNALGVPNGYNAFFTRGVTGWEATTERHWEMAKRISGLEKPNMIVYGGGKDMEAWCRERGIVWVHEYINRTRKDRE